MSMYRICSPKEKCVITIRYIFPDLPIEQGTYIGGNGQSYWHII